MALLEPDDSKPSKAANLYVLNDAEKAALDLQTQFKLKTLSINIDNMSPDQLKQFAFEALVQLELRQKMYEGFIGQAWGILDLANG